MLQFSDESATIPRSGTVQNNNNIKADEQVSLKQKKKEIEDEIKNLQRQLKDVDDRLQFLQQEEDSEMLYGHIGSPFSVDPLEFLPPDQAKRPENIYKVFRQSCSFLKTPRASAFRKESFHSPIAKETPNISRRLQQQLADLFDD